MPERLTDLLSPERRAALARGYFLRLGTVSALFATALVIAAAALLAPTYVFLARSIAAREARLASMKAAFASSDDAALSARLSAIKDDADALSALEHSPSVSATVRSALAVSRAGVALSGFEYAPPAAKRPGSLTISGTAATRDALRGYQLALENAPFASSVSLPVSTYAKDKDIPFTITVTLAP